MTARLGVFISGSGRTLMNLHDRCRSGELDAEIPLVVSSAATSGLDRARRAGLHTQLIKGEIPAETLASLASEHRLDLIILAGYLKLVRLPTELEGRVLNIHPALLPKFGGAGMYGHRVHRAVLDAGETESGCTVHECDNAYDTGRILLQARCPVLADDTPETLADRVFALETEAYPAAIRMALATLGREARTRKAGAES